MWQATLAGIVILIAGFGIALLVASKKGEWKAKAEQWANESKKDKASVGAYKRARGRLAARARRWLRDNPEE